MKQDITQKGGEYCEPPIYTGNDEFDKKKKQKHDECNARNDAERQNRIAERYFEQQQARENREKEIKKRKQLAQEQAAAKKNEEAAREEARQAAKRKEEEARQAAKKKEEADIKAAEKKKQEEKAAEDAEKYKKNEIIYSTGMFSSSPIEYTSEAGSKYKFYINKNGDKFVGRILLSNGQENQQVKYLWDPKNDSLRESVSDGDINAAQSASAYILKEKEFEPIKTKALAKIEPKEFSSNNKQEKIPSEGQVIYVGGKRKTKKSKKSKKSTKKSKKSTKKTRKSRK